MAGVLTLIGGSLAKSAAPYSIELLLVGGGGAGGYCTALPPDQAGGAGGGGAGEFAFATSALSSGVTYTVTVGAGGSLNSGSGFHGSQGIASSFSNAIKYSTGATNAAMMTGPFLSVPSSNNQAAGGGGGGHTLVNSPVPAPGSLFGYDGQTTPSRGDSLSAGGGGGSAASRKYATSPFTTVAPGGYGGTGYVYGGTTQNAQLAGYGGVGGPTTRGPGPAGPGPSTTGRTGAGGGGGGMKRAPPSGPLALNGGNSTAIGPGEFGNPYAARGAIGGSGGSGETFPYDGIIYGGGGGGGGGQTTASPDNGGTGGVGGGGRGRSGGPSNQSAADGTANRGGGGGGAARPANITGPVAGGAGGSGIVILVIPTPNYPGAYAPIASTPPLSPGKTLLTYTSSGTYTA